MSDHCTTIARERASAIMLDIRELVSAGARLDDQRIEEIVASHVRCACLDAKRQGIDECISKIRGEKAVTP